MKSEVCHFSALTFAYFESAKRNKKNPQWFQKNEMAYEEYVKKPFEHLTDLLQKNFAEDLPKIDFLPRKISKPVLRNPDEDGGALRTNASAFFSEKPTSQFEWNPGIYISIGVTPNDNVIGLGLYMVSSRQMSLLRSAIVDDLGEIDSILSNKKIKKSWGGLRGEIYKRFPRGYSEDSEAAKYLKHKQFFLGQDLTKKQICDKKFTEHILRDLDAAIPFLQWVRSKVGVYKQSF